jgi:hypothetical protein
MSGIVCYYKDVGRWTCDIALEDARDMSQSQGVTRATAREEKPKVEPAVALKIAYLLMLSAKRRLA